MGFNFNKRVNLGNGVGMNISKYGVSTSYRTKHGSLSYRGFSIRTGIPGLTFRSSWGNKSRKGNEAIIRLVILLITGAFILAAVIGWNLLRFISWGLVEIYHFILRKIETRKLRNEFEAKNLE
jgi:NADH:ubiquinone oxidoreductase subunit 2 (subunit N)